MTRTFLIATVAALAITAPAQAQRADREAERAQKAEERKAKAEQAQAQRAAPAQAQRQERVRVERPQRQERVQIARPQRQERVRIERPQRQERVQVARPQRQERVRVARPQRQERVRVERAQRQERVRVERPQREQRVRIERPQREQRVRVERPQRQERVQRVQSDGRFDQRQLRQQQRQAERLNRTQDRFERRAARTDLRATQRALMGEARAERFNRPQASVGERLDTVQRQSFVPLKQSFEQDWYGDYAAQRYRSFYDSTPDYFYDYNYDDGYLYQFDRDSSLVTALFPLLGGAFGVGQPLPFGYASYNVPYGYRSLYYDTPDYFYRYGDGAIYRVDQDTLMIQAVVALLTGQSLGIGQRLPLGYDVYNVPYAYRDMYYDTSDAWYRYDDGYIYQVDPYSRMIEQMYPVSYGQYAVGYPVPAYASYGGYGAYPVPYGYQNLYYAQPGYNYQYASGGIYQVDPTTQLISALVALVTGTNLGVGQMLPLGYDAYNVPYAYRSSYFDTPEAIYRYDDGYIYQADPRTRIIQTAIPLSYGVYPVGYTIPAYAGFAVPNSYDGLYYPQPGYDYRYANGGIYAVDPDSLQVQAVAALLTGQSLGVGQMLPVGVDVYNVPYAYRSNYYDTPNSWYRYSDGYIYQVDPQTRVIQAVIDAIV